MQLAIFMVTGGISPLQLYFQHAG